MSDLARRVQRSRAAVAPDWNDDRAARALRGVAGKRRRRTLRRAALGAMLVVATALLVVVLLRPRSTPSIVALAPVPTTSAHLEDGSVVASVGSETRVAWRQITPSNVVLGLARGHVRCDVTPNPARLFRVEAGTVTIDVLGTAFDVEREERTVKVSVTRGLVRVSSPEATRELRAGESASFAVGEALAPPSAPRDAEAPEPRPDPSPAPAAASTPRPTAPVPTARWQALARDGAFEEAYAALRREGGASMVADDVQDLLLFADVARHSGRPAEAIAPLQRITTTHRADARAPLAAFTLGRLLLDELGRPIEAAAAFADARHLAPDGALAEDAFAREVEAWSRGGNPEKARALANEYLDKYPFGSRAQLVRRHGGLR